MRAPPTSGSTVPACAPYVRATAVDMITPELSFRIPVAANTCATCALASYVGISVAGNDAMRTRSDDCRRAAAPNTPFAERSPSQVAPSIPPCKVIA